MTTVTYTDLEIGETFPIAYVSKNFETGLQDVLVHIYDPTYTHVGSAIMTERVPGIYFHDFETEPSDPVGYYYFTMDSPTYSRAAAQRVRFRATAELYTLFPSGNTVWSAGQTQTVDLLLKNKYYELFH